MEESLSDTSLILIIKPDGCNIKQEPKARAEKQVQKSEFSITLSRETISQ